MKKDIKLKSVNEEIIYMVYSISKLRREKIFLVGGYVRDLILKRESHDLDFAIEGNAIAFGRALAELLGIKGTKIRENSKYMSINITFKKVDITITPTRLERYIEKKVEYSPCSVKEDFLRRDFTVNSLYLDLKSMEIMDFCGGLVDLNSKVIKSISNGSFEQDPTRIIRALRYKHELNLTIDDSTKEELIESIFLLSKAPQIRLEKEMKRTLKIDNLKDLLLDPIFISIFKELGCKEVDLNSILQKYLSIKDEMLTFQHYLWIKIVKIYPESRMVKILKPSKKSLTYIQNKNY